ncbi:MAG: OsmC family protein [Chitinophagales bacterium]
MGKQHHYQLTIQWTGNNGTGTSGYRDYERSHSIIAEYKVEILASSDPVFRGDKTKYNPEDLLVASISGCHLLSYLHLCAVNGVVVVDYADHATGTMEETADGGGHFTEITLHPVVTVTDASMIEKANALHEAANKVCFIAASVNFHVHHEPMCKIKA